MGTSAHADAPTHLQGISLDLGGGWRPSFCTGGYPEADLYMSMSYMPYFLAPSFLGDITKGQVATDRGTLACGLCLGFLTISEAARALLPDVSLRP